MSAASRVVVARSFEELEPLRGAWERLQGRHFATDPDVFPSILAWQDAVRPHAIALERDGEVHTLVLARVEDIRLTTKVGYAAVYKPKVRALTLVYRGVLGELSDKDAELVLGELRRELATGSADLLRLRALEVGIAAAPRRLERDPAGAPRAQLRSARTLGARRPRLVRRVPQLALAAARVRAPSAIRRSWRRSSATGSRSRSSATSPTASASSPTCAASPRRPTSKGSASRSRRPSCSTG